MEKYAFFLYTEQDCLSDESDKSDWSDMSDRQKKGGPF